MSPAHEGPVPTGHDAVEALLGAYALDAVEPEEAAAVEAHLATCRRCAAEVARHHEVAGLLANSGGDAPAELWDRISERLERPVAPTMPAVPPVLGIWTTDGRGPRTSDSRGPRNSESRGPGTGGSAASRGQLARPVAWAAGAVATAAAVAALFLGIQVHHLDRQVTAMQASAGSNRLAGVARAALEDPAATRVRLTARASGPDAGAVATVVLERNGAAFLIAKGLPSLPGSQTYQLWGAVDGQLISLGLLGPHPTVVAFSLATSSPVRAFAVTAERAGGVVRTTHTPVVEGSVPV
jgi:anti-sigma factor RsiW